MLAYTEQPIAASAAWTMRAGLFSAAIAFVAVVMHRLVGLPTPTALNLFLLAFCGAGLALLLAMVAVVQIWRGGQPGFVAVVVGVAAALAILAWPALLVPTVTSLPPIYDVTTDLNSPPELTTLAKLRGLGTNPVAYPASFAEQQARAYPDLKPFVLERSADEAFEMARDALKTGMKFQIVSEVPPGGRLDQPGVIEAVDRTLVVGFYDDVVVRVIGDKVRSRIDVRSSSRYGPHDLGRNATRVRAIMKELKLRLDNSIPLAPGQRISRMRSRFDKTAVAKRVKGSGRGQAGRRSEQDRARSDAQRGQEQRAKQR